VNTVFIGGSRRVARLNPIIRERLDNIITKGLRIVIGDANGSDRAVQAYLAERGYRNMIVYCMANGCRNNVGDWPLRAVEAAGKRGFDYYALKDAEMAKAGDCGFMIWDGKSRGTLLNIQRLLADAKPVVVYFAPERRCHTIRAQRELDKLLEKTPYGGRKSIPRASHGAQAPLFSPKHGRGPG